MPLWREHDDAGGIVRWHLMAPGPHGQPASPACLRTTDGGLWFDVDTDWLQLPERARCVDCCS